MPTSPWRVHLSVRKARDGVGGPNRKPVCVCVGETDGERSNQDTAEERSEPIARWPANKSRFLNAPPPFPDNFT